MTPEQCQEARALIGWSRKDLAEAALISSSTLHRFERSGVMPNEGLLIDTRQALEAAGVIFIEQNGEGFGVRLRKSGATE